MSYIGILIVQRRYLPLVFALAFCVYFWISLELIERWTVIWAKRDEVVIRTEIFINNGSVHRHGDRHTVSDVTEPIVTMFTTLRDKECRKEIHNRLIRNWAALRPELDPVLFVPFTEYNTSWPKTAAAHNWTVLMLYSLRQNLPILTTMFKEVIARSRTPFVGYANADILFDRSLISTLRYLGRTLDLDRELILITGRRRNVKLSKFDLGPGDNLTRISKMDKVWPYHGMAQDYFITTRRGLPWRNIPDFVVGRNGYDNWLVAKALDWKLTLIDSSKTVLALHQTGKDGYMSGSLTVPKSTRNLNTRLVKGVRYTRGVTDNAPFYTAGQCSADAENAKSKHCNQVYNLTLVRRHRNGGLKKSSNNKGKARLI